MAVHLLHGELKVQILHVIQAILTLWCQVIVHAQDEFTLVGWTQFWRVALLVARIIAPTCFIECLVLPLFTVASLQEHIILIVRRVNLHLLVYLPRVLAV